MRVGLSIFGLLKLEKKSPSLGLGAKEVWRISEMIQQLKFHCQRSKEEPSCCSNFLSITNFFINSKTIHNLYFKKFNWDNKKVLGFSKFGVLEPQTMEAKISSIKIYWKNKAKEVSWFCETLLDSTAVQNWYIRCTYTSILYTYVRVYDSVWHDYKDIYSCINNINIRVLVMHKYILTLQYHQHSIYILYLYIHIYMYIHEYMSIL